MRLGVLDIGSNTGHLLVVDASVGAAPLPASSHKQPLRLAEHLDESGAVTVGIRNAIVVVGEDGSAEFLGTLANYTSEETTVELEARSDDLVLFSGSVVVPAGGTVVLGDDGEQTIAIGDFPVPAGAVFTLDLSAGGETIELTVPVTDTSLDHYGDATEAPAG